MEVLQGAGILEHGTDYSADMLFQKFKDKEIHEVPYAGCLIFWFSGNKAIHVEMMINRIFCIGASGGGSSTLTVDDASRQNAFVKMRPVNYRGVEYRAVDPF